MQKDGDTMEQHLQVGIASVRVIIVGEQHHTLTVQVVFAAKCTMLTMTARFTKPQEMLTFMTILIEWV